MIILDKNRPFDGQHIVYIGGSGGMGMPTSKSLLKKGANLTITTLPNRPDIATIDRSFQEIASQTNSKVQIIELDITKGNQIKEMLEKAEKSFGKIDKLIIAAGVSHLGSLLDVSRDEWDAIMDVNVWGILQTVQMAVPYFNKGARIVVFGSDVGFKPSHDIPLYSISKIALHTIVVLLAQELAKLGFSISGLAPYNTPPGMKWVYKKVDGKLVCGPEDCDTPDWGNLPPTGSFIDLQTIMKTVDYLLDSSHDLNGTIIPITGGYGMTVS
jgi:NAD(P)-dependent dehydrogenase (short-subunit alcohol dehydrogenase family)